MTAVPEAEGRWSTRRWLYSFLAAFAVQAGLVWFLGQSAPQPATPPLSRTALHLVVDPWSSQKLSTWPGLEDPTLFALPNQHGFSGPAWLRFPPLEFALPEWTEPPRCLELQEAPLAEAFPRMVRTNAWPPLQIADQPMPRSIIPDFAVFPLAPTHSECRVEGDLAQRQWLQRPVLPSWTRTDFLTNSVVQLVADEEGLPFSTRLLGTSGLAEADQYALDLARQARFAPLLKTNATALAQKTFTWGTMTFYWHCVPPPATTNLPLMIP